MCFSINNCSRLFFTAFLDVGTLGEEKISSITEESYRAMTSNGDVNLDFHIYKLSFLNFLLGKQPNGPGQFLFGTVTPETPTCMFPIGSTESVLELVLNTVDLFNYLT